MKLYYDEEYNILKDIHDLTPSECLIISDQEGTTAYDEAAKIIDDILSENGLSRWADNSKSKFPPDLINEQDLLAMEVMRVDDHSSNGKKNPVLAKQRAMSEEARGLVEQMPNHPPLIINAITDLPTERDHNYRFYYSSFQRTLRKHLSKLPQYKENYPNSKIIFCVFDETSGVYFERATAMSDFGAGGRIHLPFCDKRFLDEFMESDLDYLMWYIPYNHYETIGAHLTLPHLIIFDIKNAKKNPDFKRLDYDEKMMVSNEK